MNKFLNTEYELNPSNHSGIAKTTFFFVIRGLKKWAFVKILGLILLKNDQINLIKQGNFFKGYTIKGDFKLFYILNFSLEVHFTTVLYKIADHSGLRHELSLLARTLGSWVRIPLKAWMYVCAFILCLCCPVCK
jgi:hypothetical protein